MYLMFAGDKYDACGGWDDFAGSFKTLEQAIPALQSLEIGINDSWAHIVLDEQIVYRAWGTRKEGWKEIK